MSKTLKYYLIFFLFIGLQQLFAQNEFNSSEELKAKANELFEKEDYIQAFPLYSQMLSLDKTDPILNYRFGVCLLYSDRSDTYAPINYLNKALEHISEPNIYYHLGFAHHINYNFPSAISYYEKYKARVGKKANPSFEVSRKIEMCKNGMLMMRSVKDLFVLEKNEVSRNDFFRSYDLKEYGGKMIKKPEDFLSKEDLKYENNDFIFFNSKAQEVYYSSYSKQNKDQKDIFKRSRLAEGGWSSPERLPDIINTPYDDDFVVMMPDGKTLYFSSKGHNTIGGYDIFKSVFDENQQTWSTPENVNFPFNTPVDDILFVSDADETTAWFASVRSSVADKIMVYKVGIIKRPDGSDDLAAIYAKNKTLTEADLKRIKDRASLDVNISEEEYHDIPVPEKPIAVNNPQNHNSDEMINSIEELKLQKQMLTDSAEIVLSRFEKNIDDFDSVRQLAQSLAASKRLESHRLREEVKLNMKLSDGLANMDGLNIIIVASNYSLAKAEQLDFIANGLDDFVYDIKNKIDRQNQNFNTLVQKYGDAENAIFKGDLELAQGIIASMHAVELNAPKKHEMIEEFPKYEGLDANKELPENLRDPNSYQAFVIKNINSIPIIVSTSNKFEEYIPQKEEVLELAEEVNKKEPTTELEEYIDALSTQFQNNEILIQQKKDAINNLLKGSVGLNTQQKKEQIQDLNKVQQELVAYQSQSKWLNTAINTIQEEYGNASTSELSQLEIENGFKALKNDLEKSYNFSNKTFKESTISTPEINPTVYSISNNGEIVKHLITSENIIASSDLEFEEVNADLFKLQSIQMISNVRKQNKINAFGQRKIEQIIDELKEDSEQVFYKANQTLIEARKSPLNDKQKLLDEANIEFANVKIILEQLNQYTDLKERINSNNAEGENVSIKMLGALEVLEDQIANKNWEKVKESYLEIEEDYYHHREGSDFSDDYDHDSGVIFSNVEENQQNELPAYQLNAQNQIIKTYGKINQDWTSTQEFASEVISEEATLNLLIAPNIDKTSKEDEYEKIFTHQSSAANDEIFYNKPRINSIIQNTPDQLVQSTLNQLSEIEKQLEIIIEKRNQLNTFYNEQIEESKLAEQQSLRKINSRTITKFDLEESNQLSLEGKYSLYKALVASTLIKQYDQMILKNSSLISQAVMVLDSIQDHIELNTYSDAKRRNDQLNQQFSENNATTIDESKFNFITNEITEALPELFQQPENQEFLIVNNEVQRNRQTTLNHFFSQNTPKISPEIAASPFISLGEPKYEIVELATVDSSETLNLSNQPNTKELTVQAQNENETTSVKPNYEIISAKPNKAALSNSEELIRYIQSINSAELVSSNDFTSVMSGLTNFAQSHIAKVDELEKKILVLAENKIAKSNQYSIEAESAKTADLRKQKQDSSKKYLYQALALKAIADEYHKYQVREYTTQNQIADYIASIENEVNNNNYQNARIIIEELQAELPSFGAPAYAVFSDINSNMLTHIEASKNDMESAYTKSQHLANESVKLLSEASEDRQDAEKKRNAFKRREGLQKAEVKEIEATKNQNESEKALALGNQYYQDFQMYSALKTMQVEIEDINGISIIESQYMVNQDIIFDGIEERRAEVIGGQLNTTSQKTAVAASPLAETDDLHVYERENFKAEMLTEELELIKREIALLVQSQESNLSPKESYLLTQKVKLLRQRADSLEYEANKVFDLADRILETLSEEEQKEAKKTNRDFNNYLSDLKNKIEVLLSEASSLKQRANRSNNIQTRENLFEQAKNKEEVAMYLILEEFEVIAQKNKTRYRKNQLILEQLMMDLASPEERDLMRNIFAQIDDYFDQAQQKREKANQAGISFNMKKILLQDAYSLEMKALDLQQQAKTMLEKHDRKTMLAYQIESETEEIVAESIIEIESDANNTENKNDLNKANVSEQLNGALASNEDNSQEIINIQQENTNQSEVDFIYNSEANGVIYRVQFTALRALKELSFFDRVSEISAEKVEGTDFIRYFSGHFSNIDDAIIRRSALRSSGYPDAFIRSWNDGVSVSLMSLRENQDPDLSSINSVAVVRRTSVGDIDFSATNISSLQGVYYTVQVGVYSRPRTSAMIYGIKPLYHKRMNNGFWVYYSGIFNSIIDATNRKDEIVIQGVSDAFVVAFSNGSKVSFTEARQQITSGGIRPPDEDIVILEDASLQIDSQWKMSQQAAMVNENSELVYKVQVGVYSNQINLNWVASQVDGNYSIATYQNENGKFVYTIGEFSNIDEARKLLKEAQDIVPDAFLVGFQNGIKSYIR